MSDNENTVLHEASKREIDTWVAKYPYERRRSAILPALHIAQDQNQGYLTDALMAAVADYLDLPAVYIYEAASFYSMYDLKPVGRHKIFVCNSISCMLRGSDPLTEHLKQRLNIGIGETTADGKITLKEVECLAACGGAPAVMVNKTYYENMTPEKIDKIIEELE
jgi:NADH-quinone oxidoreductase subunit E